MLPIHHEKMVFPSNGRLRFWISYHFLVLGWKYKRRCKHTYLKLVEHIVTYQFPSFEHYQAGFKGVECSLCRKWRFEILSKEKWGEKTFHCFKKIKWMPSFHYLKRNLNLYFRHPFPFLTKFSDSKCMFKSFSKISVSGIWRNMMR